MKAFPPEFKSVVQWFDSDYGCDNLAVARAKPDQVDFGRCTAFLLLHAACLGVFWVIRELPIVLDMKRLAKTRRKFKRSRYFVIVITDRLAISLELSVCDRLTRCGQARFLTNTVPAE
mgnify:CR=1 FL=1